MDGTRDSDSLNEGDEADLRNSPQSLNSLGISNRAAVPAACVACRSKHLKCDGATPCSRCITQGLDCSYVKSRRGYKGPRKTVKQLACPVGQTLKSSDVSYNFGRNITESANTPSSIVLPDLTVTDVFFQENKASASLTLSLPHDSSTGDISSSSPIVSSNVRDLCLEAFFRYTYPAHPFILPRQFLQSYLQIHPRPHLVAAMSYLGSYYVPSSPKKLLERELIESLESPNCPRDGFSVQARLLYTIALDGNMERRKALEVLNVAQDIALEIGMHRRFFATANGHTDVMQESWRRTWWELYVVDGMIAGVHQQSFFRLNDIETDVLLPGEEEDYALGRINIPRSMAEFDDDCFAGDDLVFSSYTYRIAAIRNLGRLLRLPEFLFSDDPLLGQADAYLVNWGLHLPSSKKLCTNAEGQVDEMLFQAQMITNASTIMLHKQHSQLDTSVVKDVTSCAPHREVKPGQLYNFHAAKIIQAADNISKLITFPTPIIKHTPFFTCVITLSSIVHLSCWASLLPLSQDDNLKQQIKLNTGALRTIGEAWPSAHEVMKQVKGVAQEVFSARKQAAEEGFWNCFTDEEMLRSMVEDQAIVNGFELLQ